MALSAPPLVWGCLWPVGPALFPCDVCCLWRGAGAAWVCGLPCCRPARNRRPAAVVFWCCVLVAVCGLLVWVPPVVARCRQVSWCLCPAAVSGLGLPGSGLSCSASVPLCRKVFGVAGRSAFPSSLWLNPMGGLCFPLQPSSQPHPATVLHGAPAPWQHMQARAVPETKLWPSHAHFGLR